MIAITPEIIGPGIEEEYADAMERIEVLLRILEPFPCSNDTPEGRLHYQVLWFRQEIEAGRLPIPLDRKYYGTLAYLVGSCTLNYLPGIATPMGNLTSIFDGTGMIKPRHYPVVISLIDDLLARIANPPELNEAELRLIDDLHNIRAGLAEIRYKIPLSRAEYPSLYRTSQYITLKKDPSFLRSVFTIGEAVLSSWRPTICRKGPLAPPNPSELAWAGEIKGKPQGQA